MRLHLTYCFEKTAKCTNFGQNVSWKSGNHSWWSVRHPVECFGSNVYRLCYISNVLWAICLYVLSLFLGRLKLVSSRRRSLSGDATAELASLQRCRWTRITSYRRSEGGGSPDGRTAVFIPITINILCSLTSVKHYLHIDLYYRQHCAQRKPRRYLIYSEANFEGFRPAGATRCTDGGKIWHGGGDQRSPPPCNFTPLVQRQGGRTPKSEIFTQIWPKCGI